MNVKKEKTRMTSNMKKIQKENRGITLIALVITIVVLIILATISINAVLGDNGLIKQAEKAADAQANAEAADQGTLSGYEQYIANTLANTGTNGGGNNKETLEITYAIEDIDASAKAVKLSFPNLKVSIEKLELMAAGTEGFTNFEDFLNAIGPMTKAEFEEMVKGQTGLDYEEGLKVMLQGMGVDTSVAPTEVTIGNRSLVVANAEFIATRNGTYKVKAETEDKSGEIEIEVTGIEEEKFSQIYTTTQEYTDGKGDKATIPAGFAVGTSNNINTIDNGLVITDAVDSEGYSIGNEFVWIPVANELDLTRTYFDSTTGQATNSIDSMYTEPFNYNFLGTIYTGYEGEEKEYNEMETQVLAYHGFYIGRYEAGDSTIKDNFRREATEAHRVVSKRGVAPYNYVPWGKAMDDSSERAGESGAVYLSKNMYKNSSSITSTLVYGSQWDAMCRFIGDSNRTTETKNRLDLTGRIGNDNSKNIYDLAGNCWEWTMEAYYTNSRVGRGGDYEDEDTVSFRNYSIPDDSDVNYSFRLGLYISNPES